MKSEKSAGAIIFRESSKGRLYLVLAYSGIKDSQKVIWGFPKGGTAEGESEEETARREVSEETGLTEFSFVLGFKEKEKYLYQREGEFINKTVVYFLAQTTQEAVTVSFEHVGFEWLSFEDSLQRLSFKNAHELLQKAENFLSSSDLSQPRLI